MRWPMNRILMRLRRPLRNERGEITFFACFFVVGVVMLISFLLLYASIRINCINIRNGAKMELNNLSALIYADTYRSQRETNFILLHWRIPYRMALQIKYRFPLMTTRYQIFG